MKSLLRVLFASFVVATSISLSATVYQTIYRAARRDWIITTAEITFIGAPEGVVYGTFTDCNGKVHSQHKMYYDNKFVGFLLNYTLTDSEPYLGTTVRIMYDPSTLALEERTASSTDNNGETVFWYRGIKIESYDNWLRSFIVSVSVFGVSAVLLAGVIIIWNIRERAEKTSGGENGTANV